MKRFYRKYLISLTLINMAMLISHATNFYCIKWQAIFARQKHSKSSVAPPGCWGYFFSYGTGLDLELLPTSCVSQKTSWNDGFSGARVHGGEIVCSRSHSKPKASAFQSSDLFIKPYHF